MRDSSHRTKLGSLSNRTLLVNNLLDLALYAGNRVVSAVGTLPMYTAPYVQRCLCIPLPMYSAASDDAAYDGAAYDHREVALWRSRIMGAAAGVCCPYCLPGRYVLRMLN
jgi:hypothetical protein